MLAAQGKAIGAEIDNPDWRDGVREATDAYRAIHGDRPVTAGLAARARTPSRT